MCMQSAVLSVGTKTNENTCPYEGFVQMFVAILFIVAKKPPSVLSGKDVVFSESEI